MSRFTRWCRRMWWLTDPLTLKRKRLAARGIITHEDGTVWAIQGMCKPDFSRSTVLPWKVPEPSFDD